MAARRATQEEVGPRWNARAKDPKRVNVSNYGPVIKLHPSHQVGVTERVLVRS